MPRGITLADDLVQGLWLINGTSLETAIQALGSARLFVAPDGDWIGNEYWWVKSTEVPDWLSFIRTEAHAGIWSNISDAVSHAPSAPRVQPGALRIGGANKLGVFLATVDGELLPFGFPPNHMFFVERMTGAADWRFSRAGEIQCFVALDDGGEAVGLVSACVREDDGEAA